MINKFCYEKHPALLLSFILVFRLHEAPGSPTSSQVHVFKGIDVINTDGMEMGTWGTDDGDWETDAAWTASEYGLLNFPDTISLDGTYIKDTIGWNIGPGIHEQPRNVVIVYPNPAYNQQVLVFRGLGWLKFKATIVDKNYNRLFTFTCKNSNASVVLDLSDSVKFQNGTIYRLFYSLSARDSLNFYKGHGDILICRENSLQDCRKFVP
jgi:hypothetical protein